MIILALVGILLFSFLIGLPIAIKKFNSSPFSIFLFSIIISLYASFFITFLEFFFKINLAYWLWIIIILLCLFFSLRKTSNKEYKISSILLFTIVTIIAVLILYYTLPDKYSLIFKEFDAVVSWNRWAIELSDNEYNPMNSAYPIFWPSLWSLIYKIQLNNGLWIFAKITLFILPFSFFLLAFKSFVENYFLQPLFSVFIFINFFLLGISDKIYNLYSGYMDGPLTLLIFLALYAMLMVIKNKHSSLFTEYLILAGLFVGIACVTKQNGVSVLLVYSVLLLYYFITKRIKFKNVIVYGLVTITPLILFLIMFVSESSIKQILGNYNLLSNIGEDVFIFEKAKSVFHYYSDVLGHVNFCLLLILSALNFLRLKADEGKFGVLLLIISVISFVFYADCCFYGERNSMFIVPFIVISAISGLSLFSDRIDNRVKNSLESIDFYFFKKMISMKYFIVYILLIFILPLLLFSSKKQQNIIIDQQVESQLKLGNEYESRIIQELLKNSNNQTKLITNNQLSKYNYNLIEFGDRIIKFSGTDFSDFFKNSKCNCETQFWSISRNRLDNVRKKLSNDIIMEQAHPDLDYVFKITRKIN